MIAAGYDKTPRRPAVSGALIASRFLARQRMACFTAAATAGATLGSKTLGMM